ncbi:MAG: thymidine phosphorylase [bacterium]|nr:thymidine phosphorylase [bacterium]
MNMVEIITRKKLGQALSEDEIRYFVAAAADRAHSDVPDYQLSALLMAIRLMGMNSEETTALTLAMRDSGDVADLSAIPGIKVDKHSTGGVGDTTTLVLAPMVAACGVPVAKMSGRGLGHTGGTLDKLESIPGFSVEESEDQFIRQVKDIGLAVIGQTGQLAPADKTLYALRDVTSTVDSLPLIASSIMSKKLASGADAIVLDVKTGSGAIMQTLDDSIALAKAMVDIGTLAGKPVTAIVTGMEQPLGTHVGNALEVKDAIDVLSGRTAGALLDVSLLLGSHMLMLAGRCRTPEEGRRMLESVLRSGAALSRLKAMIKAQGGDSNVCDDLSLLPQPAFRRTVRCGVSSYVQAMDTMALGLAAQAMGAGRIRKSDKLDYSVGFILPVRIGDYVTPDQTLCTLLAKSAEDADRAEAAIRAAITIGVEKPALPPLCYAIVTRDGVQRMDA